MKLSNISFGTNPRIVIKFLTDWFRIFDENWAEKKYIMASWPYTFAAATLRYAYLGGVSYRPWRIVSRHDAQNTVVLFLMNTNL